MSKKLVSFGVVLALVAAVLVSGSAVSAQTTSLCSTVDALISAGVIAPDKAAAAKAAAGCSSASTSAVSFTRELTVGSTGADVTALQVKLGVTPATGYFGAITKAAVMAYQAANGLPATGYVGPLTLAKLNYVAPSAPSTPSTSNNSSDLEGTDGTIEDVNELSSYSNEEVGEGDEDVKILGAEVEASNDGDIELVSVKVSFDPAGNGGSDHLDDYIDGVSIFLGSTKVGSADAEDFNQNDSDVFTKTISLEDAVVEAGETVKIYVAVDAVGNLDSSDISSDSWTVDIESIRFEDGSGVVTTDTTSGDIDGMNVAFDFVSFSDSADTELKISLDSSSPEADIVIADEDDTTEDVVLVKGKIKIEGDSDVVVDELPVTLTVTGATDVDNVTDSVTLTIDGEDYTETVSTSAETSATVTFDNLDLTLEAGKTYTFTVSADILEVDSINFNEGDTLLAKVSADNRSAIDAENEEGDNLADDEKTGTATGEAQEFRTEGISVALVSVDESVSASDTDNQDSATFTIKFKVTAIGDDVYVATTVTAGTDYAVERSGTATTVNVSGVVVNTTDTDITSGYNWLVEDGSSETITLTVLKAPGVSDFDGLYRAVLSGVRWNSDDSNDTYNTYSSNLDDFVTDYVSLN